VASLGERERRTTFAENIAVASRARSAVKARFIATIQDDEIIRRFVNSADAARLAALGTSCPDHFLRTKIKPLYVQWDPQSGDLTRLKALLSEALPPTGTITRPTTNAANIPTRRDARSQSDGDPCSRALE
jgi:rhamnose utilization protein RhaD (predicted bifunctional aldolase and dehydrogenase)